jgi:hypothetical protein
MTRTVRISAGHVAVRWLALLLALGLHAGLHAQVIDTSQFINGPFPLPDTAAPIRPIWGFNTDEYSVGAYMGTDTGSLPNIWSLARSLGVKIIEDRADISYGHYDFLAGGAIGRDTATGRWNERVITYSEPFDLVGWAREAILYPFDSTQWYYWPCLFRNKSGGFLDSNLTVTDHQGHRSREQVYDTSNTSPHQEIASRIVFGYDPATQVRRYQTGAFYDDIQKDSTELSGNAFWVRQDLDLSNKLAGDNHWDRSRHLWFVVTGHLFDTADGGQTALDPDSLLALDIWLEVTNGDLWTDSTGTIHTASSDEEHLYKTIYVTKADLKPDSLLNYNRYREVAIPVDMARDPSGGIYGPWYVDSHDRRTRRFDLRVRWTGAEKLALRSIAIRDSAGQLLFGADTAGAAFRQWIASSTDHVMYGSTTVHDPDTLARRMGKIIRLAGGDEAPPLFWAGFSYLDSMLYRRYPSLRAADSLTRGTRTWHGMNDRTDNRCLNTSENEITVETYQFNQGNPLAAVAFGLPAYILTLPALPEHNGGRFGGGRWDTVRKGPVGIVQLTVDTSLTHSNDSVALYTAAIQRMFFGEYYHGPLHGLRGQVAYALGNAAVMSRRTGRRIIHWPGNHITFSLTWRQVVPGLVIQDSSSTVSDGSGHQWTKDIPFPRLPEGSELRAMANIGICYGARGIHWPFIGCNSLTLNAVALIDSLGHRHYAWGSDWGDIGPLVSDSNDYKRPDSLFIFYNADSTVSDTIPDLYTAWGTRLRAIRWINSVWLGGIGPEMVKLRWRDGYSMHFTVTQTYPLDSGEPHVRPLPANEIVRSIEAWDRYGHKDSAVDTYVELGLFDRKPGATTLLDTQHVYLVNRRTFERPDGISPTSARGKFLDSLAETREVVVRFNLPHPDSSQYNFLHIQEVAADTSRLPGTNAPRAGLDTVVSADSAVALWMRPGGGALLRITYAPPDTSIVDGDLRYNNQRKMVFDGVRYYCCYGRNDSVFFRRSLPVTSSTGAVLWSPIVECVSCNGDSSRTVNRFPSLTVRHQNRDTIVSIVWTAHPNWGYSAHHNDREVLLRDYAYGSFKDYPSEYTRLYVIQHLDFHAGAIDTTWGTPVICRADGGDIIAWSDSLWGIMARVRKNDTTSRNLLFSIPLILSPRDTVSFPWDGDGPSRYPTVPAFAQMARRDSTCGIAWQRPSSSGGSGILYARLGHARTSLGADSLFTSVPGLPIILSDLDSTSLHPSIDLQQDARRRVREGVTWEMPYAVYALISKGQLGNVYDSLFGRKICYQSIMADTTVKPYSASLFGSRASLVFTTDIYHHGMGSGYAAYPNIAAINNVSALSDPADTARFAIVFQKYDISTPPMLQATTRYINPSFSSGGWPRTYAWGGTHPAGSAAPVKLDTRYAALYEAKDTGTSRVLRTSRQFYAKSRPGGYVASGRRAIFRISDSLRTGIAVMLHDVWYSTPSGGGGAAMVERADATARTDSLRQVQDLLRSTTFHAWDSTMIGCEVHGEYLGDSTAGASTRIDGIAELVDSSSGSVVAVLDSFSITAGAREHHAVVSPTLDLVAGSYYVRLRLASPAFPDDSVSYNSRYPIEEIASWVDDDRSFGKVRLINEGSAEAVRITTQPNPARDHAEIRFTVPKLGVVTVRILDARGAEVLRPIDRQGMAPGRYAVEVDGGGLQPGAYLIDVSADTFHASGKLVVMH